MKPANEIRGAINAFENIFNNSATRIGNPSRANAGESHARATASGDSGQRTSIAHKPGNELDSPVRRHSIMGACTHDVSEPVDSRSNVSRLKFHYRSGSVHMGSIARANGSPGAGRIDFRSDGPKLTVHFPSDSMHMESFLAELNSSKNASNRVVVEFKAPRMRDLESGSAEENTVVAPQNNSDRTSGAVEDSVAGKLADQSNHQRVENAQRKTAGVTPKSLAEIKNSIMGKRPDRYMRVPYVTTLNTIPEYTN